MTKIVDPDDLIQSTVSLTDGSAQGSVYFNTALKEIELLDENLVAFVDYGTGSEANRLSTDGASLQSLYSFAKEEWKDDAELIKYPFPFIAITDEQFELTNSWDFHDDIPEVITAGGTTASATKNLIRDAGWALKDPSGDSQQEYMNITSLGTFDDSNNDQAYYLQVDGGTPSDVVLPGEVNQAIQIFGDALNGNFDYRSFFKIYLREQAKIYGFGDLIVDQNLTVLTYRKYALPLINSTDLKITVADSGISAGGTAADQSPYDGMSITYYDAPQDRNIGGTTFSFSIIIDGNSATAEEIYEFVQWSLRQEFNINAGTSSAVRGDTAEELLRFIGDTLRTLQTSDGGVYIDNFQAADTNRLEFTDDSGVIRTFPFVAAGNLLFNENLTNDADAKFWVFFTYTNTVSGTDIGMTAVSGFTADITQADGIFQVTATPSGTSMSVTRVDETNPINEASGSNVTLGDNPYGSPNAIIINDNSGSPITGSVSGQSTIGYDFDYDNNIQGGRIQGTDATFTAVSLGLSTGQYVVTTGVIGRNTSNNINFVAALERNYSNP